MSIPSVAGRRLIAAYAAGVYAFFLGVLGYTVGFLAGFGVPKGIDQGPRVAWPAAVAVDVALLLLFAVQHMVMARPWFKRRWVAAPAERATFVLCANLTLVLLFWLWRPLRGTVWRVPEPGAGALIALYAAGWVVAVAATFTISHADLFGLRQAFSHARRTAYRPPAFTRRGLYRFVRHPLMTGFLLVFWAAPTMSAGHLLFAVAGTGYIVVGIRFEQRDLLRDLGPVYRRYQSEVPALVPGRWAAVPVRTGTMRHRPGREGLAGGGRGRGALGEGGD
jgi:protein-S-isoprenylcysteine O-methyltransferase Ste14